MIEVRVLNRLTGKTNSMVLDVTQDQLDRFERGQGYVQDIFPNLTATEREFLLTGMTAEEQKEIFG